MMLNLLCAELSTYLYGAELLAANDALRSALWERVRRQLTVQMEPAAVALGEQLMEDLLK